MTGPLYQCPTCDRDVPEEEATRTRTFGDLDTDRWQTLCCPHCGERLQTVFVGTTNYSRQ